ncbi:MAG: hypothetical protein GY918_04895 [Gammaproteobacteria bacterium]|nr:hypothetical protein [Gammaproteobacteria bacterium]
MYVKVTSGQPDQYPYSVGQLRRDNPNVSFPKRVSDADLAAFNAYPVVILDQPVFDVRTQNAKQNDMPVLNGSAWEIGYTITDKTIDEVAAYDAKAAASVRKERDRLLAECDWVAIRARELGQPVPEAWYDYRGDLRQVPQQAGFPHTIDWPTMEASQ